MPRRARLTFEPLTDWPHPEPRRVRAPFTAKWTATRDLLLAEADHLGANLVVVELDLTREHLRNDGEIRANARPSSGRARVTLDTRHGALRYAVDQYLGNGDLLAWQANLRSIALTLQALRAVDRYGAVHDGEQYRGFLAIEAGPAGIGDEFATADAAARWVRQNVDPEGHVAPLADLVRAGRALWHPDRTGGDRARWDQLERAAELMRAAGMLP